MQVELVRQVIGLEYEALALAAGPLTTLSIGWLARQATTHLRDRGAAGYTARLVAWAAQAIPDKSARYGEVAGLLSRRFPTLSGEQIEVLIESEVLSLKAALRTSAPAQGLPVGTAPVPAVPQPVPAPALPAVGAPVPTLPDGTAGLRVGAG